MDDSNTWKVLDMYVRDNPNFLCKHHLESFDNFTQSKLPEIVASLNPFVVLKNDDISGRLKHEIRVHLNAKLVMNASLYPNEARLKSKTYKADLVAGIDVEIRTYDESGVNAIDTIKNTLSDIKIGAIPIMLGSSLCLTNKLSPPEKKEVGECVFDHGGYFVIDGKEKVIIAQERTVTNKLYVSRSSTKMALKNKSLIPEEKKKKSLATVTSSHKTAEPTYFYNGLVRCTPTAGAVFPKVFRLMASHGKDITCEVKNVRGRIPLFVLFRALGVESDRDILKSIFPSLDKAPRSMVDFVYPSVVKGSEMYSQIDCMEYMQKRTNYPMDINHIKYILAFDLFPNVDEDDADAPNAVMRNKAMYLGQLVHEFVEIAVGIAKETDRDHYAHKRVDNSGYLMSNKFRDLYNAFRNECRSAIDREYNYGPAKKEGIVNNLINKDNIWKIFNSSIIEFGMSRALKGQWGEGGGDGVIQDLSRLSYVGFLSHLRRVDSPIDRSIKIVAPHRLHASQFGMMCPCESPDGASIGLLKNMAVMCHITSDVPATEMLKCLSRKDMHFTPISKTMSGGESSNVTLNNNWIGTTDNPRRLVHNLKLLRRNAMINIMTSVSWDVVGKHVSIKTDAGRCCRPLYVVGPNNKLAISSVQNKLHTMSWNDLISGITDTKTFNIHSSSYVEPESVVAGSTWDVLATHQACIEFIDVEETETCMIAMTLADLADTSKTYTHCELHPSTMFAVLTASIPFANHNQAPRNYFSGGQGKQAIGVYSTQFNNRMDVTGLVLHYPQRPIVNTKYMRYMQNLEMPNGENAIVAVMCYSGYNQEDSMIINRGAIERGMFNLTYFKTIQETEDLNEYTGERVVFENPVELSKKGASVDGFGKRFANYTKLDKNGFPKINTKFGLGDVYIGKVLVKNETKEDKASESIFSVKVRSEAYNDKSAIADKTMAFIVDRVVAFEQGNGMRQCKIRTRKFRRPVLGDKHASRHAQKGTIGMIMNPEDMPRTAEGIVPDIIINPHAFPSRMTIGHKIECVLGKLGCLVGNDFDATPFCNQDIGKAYDDLQSKGYERYGNEILYNGINGEQIPTDIFIGPTYMLRLKHMVDDKINVRSPDDGYDALTHQPVKSRAKGGGLRVGEMEVFGILGHGMSSFLKESMMERSDNYKVMIDEACGDIGVANLTKGFARSLQDPSTADFTSVHMPYSMKLLMQEMQIMNIVPRMMFEAAPEEETHYLDDEFEDEEELEREFNP